MSRSVVPWRVLSRSNLSYPSRRSSLNPRPVNLLQPLCRSQKSQLLCNQANPASFCKTPGVGVPLCDLCAPISVHSVLCLPASQTRHSSLSTRHSPLLLYFQQFSASCSLFPLFFPLFS